MEDFKEILNWYILTGVDEICGEKSCDWLNVAKDTQTENKAEKRSETLNQTATTTRPATTLLAQENAAACNNAKEICRQADNLEKLRKLVENFEGCSLRFSANSTVFGDGNPEAEVMIIGEAPGADEDREGKPFVGRSGKLLSKMLETIGLKREDCYITNVLSWRPPGNRTPTDAEVAVCLPFLRRQIELVAPKVILLLGGSAANAVLENNDSISSLRGHFLNYVTQDGKEIPALASFHPAYLLRTSTQKAKAWSDFMKLQRKLKEL